MQSKGIKKNNKNKSNNKTIPGFIAKKIIAVISKI
jgi:hypothetical protein